MTDRIARARRRQNRDRGAGVEPLLTVDEVAVQAEQVRGQTDVFDQLDEPTPYPSAPRHTGGVSNHHPPKE